MRKTLDELKAPSTRIWIFLNPQLFLSGYGFRPHVFGESGIRILNVLNRLLIRNPESCGRQMRIFFIIPCVTRANPVLYHKYCIQDGMLKGGNFIYPMILRGKFLSSLRGGNSVRGFRGRFSTI